MIKLSNRLKKIAELVDFGASVIDVGTDHGYVPNFLCEENISKDIIATDISKNSLEKSIELTKKLNNEKCIKNILANGIVNEKRENIISSSIISKPILKSSRLKIFVFCIGCKINFSASLAISKESKIISAI